jgi:Tfp pilus assembly protein FimT
MELAVSVSELGLIELTFGISIFAVMLVISVCNVSDETPVE